MGIKAIVTQENQIINFNNITNILVYTANTFHAKFEVRALVAGTTSYYTLAIYDTKKSANDILNIIIDWLEKEDNPVLDLNFPEYQQQAVTAEETDNTETDAEDEQTATDESPEYEE